MEVEAVRPHARRGPALGALRWVRAERGATQDPPPPPHRGRQVWARGAPHPPELCGHGPPTRPPRPTPRRSEVCAALGQRRRERGR